MKMDAIKSWLEVATDELTTLHAYTDKLTVVEEKDKLKEIMGDEVNHALVALLTAASLLGLKVPEDGLAEAMEKVFTEALDNGN